MRQLVILGLLPLLSACTLNPATGITHLRASAQTASGAFEFDCRPLVKLSDAQTSGEQLVYNNGYNTWPCPSVDGRATLSVTRQRPKVTGNTSNGATSQMLSVFVKVAGNPATYAGNTVFSSASSNFLRPRENVTFRAKLTGGGEVKGSLSIGTE